MWTEFQTHWYLTHQAALPSAGSVGKSFMQARDQAREQFWSIDFSIYNKMYQIFDFLCSFPALGRPGRNLVNSSKRVYLILTCNDCRITSCNR